MDHQQKFQTTECHRGSLWLVTLCCYFYHLLMLFAKNGGKSCFFLWHKNNFYQKKWNLPPIGTISNSVRVTLLKLKQTVCYSRPISTWPHYAIFWQYLSSLYFPQSFSPANSAQLSSHSNFLEQNLVSNPDKPLSKPL